SCHLLVSPGVHNRRDKVFQHGVRSALIVYVNGLAGRLLGLDLAPERFAESVLALQDAIEPFRRGVLITVVYLRHTHEAASPFQSLDILPAAILRAAVRVVDGRGTRG